RSAEPVAVVPAAVAVAPRAGDQGGAALAAPAFDAREPRHLRSSATKIQFSAARKAASVTTPDGVTITGEMRERYEEVLHPTALELIATLHRRLDARRLELLEARARRVADLAAGGTLDFLPETAHIREDDSWQVAPPAPGLVDRRVEITGPTDRKMTINALN